MIVHLGSTFEETPLGQVKIIASVWSGKGTDISRDYRRFPDYGLTLVERGEGIHRSAAGEWPVSAGSLIVTLPGVPHSFGPPIGSTWDESFAIFNGPAFDSLLACGALSAERPVLRVGEFSCWRNRLDEIAAQESGISALTLLIGLLLETLRANPRDIASDLEEARSWLAGELRETRTAPEAARRIGVGYESFRKRFNAAYGMPPNRYRIEARLQSARTWIRSSTATIKNVAARVGFDPPSHFSRAYHQRFGVWPTEDRLAGRGGFDIPA